MRRVNWQVGVGVAVVLVATLGLFLLGRSAKDTSPAALKRTSAVVVTPTPLKDPVLVLPAAIDPPKVK